MVSSAQVGLATGEVGAAPEEDEDPNQPRAGWRSKAARKVEARRERGSTRKDNFKDVRFYPILNSGLFLAALLMMSVFYPTRNFRQFWTDPTFSAVRSTFLAEEEAQNVEILPNPKFWPFLGCLLKDVRFYSMLNFGHFWPPSLVTLLSFQNVINFQHLNTRTPEHLNT